MSVESVAHTIKSILVQCNSTVISIGNTEGHFLSLKQFAVLERCVDQLEDLELSTGVLTPTTSVATEQLDEEASTRARRLQVAKEIKQKQVQLAAAPAINRSDLNLEIGKLLSERAKLDKLIRQFDKAVIS